MAVAVQTAAVVGMLLLVAGVQRRESRRLALKIDALRQTAHQPMAGASKQHDQSTGQLDRVSEQLNEVSHQLERLSQQLDGGRVAELSPAAGVPQEHFEQLARLLASNNERLESTIDDLARQLETADRVANGDAATHQA